MRQIDFKQFMDDQIREIEKYKNEMIKNNPELDTNSCVLEWIEKFAKQFRHDWEGS